MQIVRCCARAHLPCDLNGDFGILESYVRAVWGAQRFIYLENQLLWSPEISAAFVEKIAAPPSPDFRLLMLLPAKPNNGSDDSPRSARELYRNRR